MVLDNDHLNERDGRRVCVVPLSQCSKDGTEEAMVNADR